MGVTVDGGPGSTSLHIPVNPNENGHSLWEQVGSWGCRTEVIHNDFDKVGVTVLTSGTRGLGRWREEQRQNIEIASSL